MFLKKMQLIHNHAKKELELIKQRYQATVEKLLGVFSNVLQVLVDEPSDDKSDKINQSDKIGERLNNSFEYENKVLIPLFNNLKISKPIIAYRTRSNNFLEALEQDNAIGNPFSHAGYSLYKSNTVKDAVKDFISWLTGEKHTDKLQDYRQAIINKIPELKNNPIYYYKDLGEPSHATALDYLINKYDWSIKQTKKPVDNKVLEGDIFSFPGIPIITTNLGGVHGAGLAAKAKELGLIEQLKNIENVDIYYLTCFFFILLLLLVLIFSAPKHLI
jgi:hypothetical protein